MNIKIEKKVSKKSRFSERPWVQGLLARPWPFFAILAFIGAVALLIFESEIETGDGVEIRIGGAFSAIYLTITIILFYSARKYNKKTANYLFRKPTSTAIMYVEILDSCFSYGIRNFWNTDYRWSSLQHFLIDSNYISFIFGGIVIKIPKHHLTDNEINEIKEFVKKRKSQPEDAQDSLQSP